MYVLIKADSTTYLDCELLGSYNTKNMARSVMRARWNDALERAIRDEFIERDDVGYACFIESDYAQIAPAHGTRAIGFFIFDTDEKD